MAKMSSSRSRSWLFIILGIVSLVLCQAPLSWTVGMLTVLMAYALLRNFHRIRKNRVAIGASYVCCILYVILLVIGYVQSDKLALAQESVENVHEVEQAGSPNQPVHLGQKPRLNTPLSERLISILGIFVLVGISWVISVNRKQISWRPVIWGVILQIILGFIVLSPAVGEFFFQVVDGGVKKLLSFSEEGATFIFQTVEPHQIISGFDPAGKSETFIGRISPPVKTFAFWVLPTIIFFSSLMTLLYHLGVMEPVIRFFAWIMQMTMGTSGSESLSTAANIFVGQTEAPLVVKPFVANMTISELHAVMVGGFATVAGGVMAAYVSFLKDFIPGIAGHLVTASIMSAPAALAISKVIFPETEESETRGSLKTTIAKPDANAIEAAARGASEGMTLTLNVAAMLVAFVGLVAMINAVLSIVGLSIEQIFGWIFAPLSWVMGIPWSECSVIGRLLGEKLVLTEFIAYINLGNIMKDGFDAGGGQIAFLSQRSAIIASYALCGFANFASIGIQIGGIGGIAPSRRADLARIGLRAMFGGAIAACMTGTVAGILL